MIDKEIELQKIQIVIDDTQTWINLAGSILIGALIADTILILTLKLNIIIGVLSLIIIGIILGGCIVYLYKRNTRFLTLVDDWIKTIEEGKSVPSIIEMKKKF